MLIILYNIFILNAWAIPFLCVFYMILYKEITKKKWSPWSAIICFIISAIFSVGIPDMDVAASDAINLVSDILYDALAGIAIYQLIKWKGRV